MSSIFQDGKVRYLTVWTFILFIVFMLIWTFSPVKQLPQAFSTRLLIILTLYITPIIWFSLLLRRHGIPLRRLFRKPIPIKIRTGIASVIMTMLFGLGMLLFVIVALTHILGQTTQETSSTSNETISLWVIIFKLLSLVFIAPICEEIVFRGYLFGRVAYKYGTSKGILISSFIFGALHLDNLFGATMFGIILCIMYVKTKSLVIPILLHISFNGIVAFRDISLLIDSGTKGTPLPSIMSIILGATTLTAVGLFWIVPFLKKHWNFAIKEGYPSIANPSYEKR
ncbi:type II CAAX endopeptidase family protein [Radiobacillus deserti]|uniref:CPBP family intramembrane metalloprotease n=1 Tax=Radiobacillus deserti TaxID=2594883 RepID=A0A516KIG0_9BACI|nr:type II CAAX endopeptidase family protein [Radiobacillus deserti]QDP41136.1 CPBP family intramembrane metalloprotease [Radiobacillus deserti]